MAGMAVDTSTIKSIRSLFISSPPFYILRMIMLNSFRQLPVYAFSAAGSILIMDPELRLRSIKTGSP